MGKVIQMKIERAPVFTDMTDMLNKWWKEQTKKPLAKPMKIRHVVGLRCLVPFEAVLFVAEELLLVFVLQLLF